MNLIPPPEDLRKWVTYDPETGLFTRLRKNGVILRGDIASNRGYRLVVHKGRRFLAHRIAWWMTHDEWPTIQIDHINLDRTDNRLVNLRLATNAQNAGNRAPSGAYAKGVSLHRPGRYVAQIGKDGKNHYLGVYPSVEEARAAYAAKAVEFFGEFARLD